MKKVLLTGLVILALFMAGCDFLPNPRLTILSHGWTMEHVRALGKWRVVISGIAVNSGNRRLSYAQVKSRIYSSEGYVLGDSSTSILGLKKRQRWYFSMVDYVSMTPASYDVWVGDLYYE